jgi:Delta7-sterol 5-desaturase
MFDWLNKLDLLDWSIIGIAVIFLTVGIVSGYFRARKIQPKGFKWKILGHELVWTTINIATAVFTLGAMRKLFLDQGLIFYSTEPTGAWVIALEFAVYFFLFDTWFYWGHRLMHVEPFYKWMHKTHHKSTSTNLLTSTSVTPFEAFLNGSFTSLFLAGTALLSQVFVFVSPIHTATVAMILPTSILMGWYVHSGFEFLPRWWNKSWATKWFISATFHDHHHRYFTGNFGGYTTIWDRLCGTMRKNFEGDFEKITTRPLERLIWPRRAGKPTA